MELNGVTQIPSSLVSCFVNGMEVQILELAMEGFSFRTPEPVEKIMKIELKYYYFKESRYHTIDLKQYKVLEEKEKNFYIEYVIGHVEAEFQKNTSYMIKDYWEYMQLKMSGDDGYCAQEKAGYPADLDETYVDSFEIQRKEWFSNIVIEERERYQKLLSELEVAVSLDSSDKYESFLYQDLNSFWKGYLKQQFLSRHPLQERRLERIYIGNEFCHNLFPDKEVLFELLKKAEQEQIGITIVFTYLRENLIEKTKRLLEEVFEWCLAEDVQIEVVINDWGMFSLLDGKEAYMKHSFGNLLNKRRKDPRYLYKTGYEESVEMLAENSLEDDMYWKYLTDKLHISRFEQESCGYQMKLPAGRNSIHMPYYQTNTSQYCTLYAKCTTGERGRQQLVMKCPEYCKEFLFLYPSHLKMTGRYNSLFGMDENLLKNADIIQYYVKSGADRIVLNFL